MEKFEYLSRYDRKKLSIDAQKEYYERYRQYLLDLPYDFKDIHRKKRNDSLFFHFLNPIMRFLYKPNLVGMENIPLNHNKGMLFVSNHCAIQDAMALKATLPQFRFHLLGKIELLDMPGLAMVFSNTCYFFVCRENFEDRARSLEYMKQLLVHGEWVILFPEGTINKSPNQLIQPYNYGALSAAQSTGCPIIPVGTSGYYFKNGQVTFAFDKPMYVPFNKSLEVVHEELEERAKSILYKAMEYSYEKRKKLCLPNDRSILK